MRAGLWIPILIVIVLVSTAAAQRVDQLATTRFYVLTTRIANVIAADANIEITNRLTVPRSEPRPQSGMSAAVILIIIIVLVVLFTPLRHLLLWWLFLGGRGWGGGRRGSWGGYSAGEWGGGFGGGGFGGFGQLRWWWREWELVNESKQGSEGPGRED